jgi:protein with PEP-CTERM/exosortase system signal
MVPGGRKIKEFKKMKNITKWLGASVVLGLLSFATQRADAVLQMSYTTDSQYLVGTVIPGLQGQSGGQAVRDAAMTNTLLGMGLQTQMGPNPGVQGDPLYSRTTWPAGPAATTTGNVAVSGLSGGTGNVFITLTGTYQYLVAAYDGQNSGVAVWDISSIAAGTTIEIYGYAKPEVVGGLETGNLLGSDHAQQGYFRITSYTLLNPLSVPDGGATVMLLGAGLGALGILRRYLTR